MPAPMIPTRTRPRSPGYRTRNSVEAGGEPLIHRVEAVELAARVGKERDRPLPDQLVRVRAVLAIEPGADCERAVGVMEDAGIGAPAVDNRHLVEVVRLVDHAAPVCP